MEGLPPGPQPSLSEQRAEAVLQLGYSLCAAELRASAVLARLRTKLQGKPRKPGEVSRAWAHAVPARTRGIAARPKRQAAYSAALRPTPPQLLQILQPTPSPISQWRPAEPTAPNPPFGLHLGLAALGMGMPSFMPPANSMRLQSFIISPPGAEFAQPSRAATATGAAPTVAGTAAAVIGAAGVVAGAGRAGMMMKGGRHHARPGLRALYQSGIDTAQLQQPAFDDSGELDADPPVDEPQLSISLNRMEQPSSAAPVSSGAVSAFEHPTTNNYAAGSLPVSDFTTAHADTLLSHGSLLLSAPSATPAAALDPTEHITWLDDAMEEI